MPGNVQEFLETPQMRELTEKGNFIAITARAARESQRLTLLWARAGLEACRSVDLIVAGVGGMYVGFSIAEKLDLPMLQAHVFPFTPTGEFPGVLFPQAVSRLGRGVNRASHELIRQVMWQGSRVADEKARKEVLDLPAAPFFGPYDNERLNRSPALYGFSPSVIPPPKDWNDARVTGYWFLDAAPDWTPPADLEAFLAKGPAPVYVGFGSMGSRNPAQTAELVLEALAKSKQRAIMQSGWGGLGTENLPVSVHAVRSVPHTWLFPRVAAVVHHGGAGTTAAGLRAGVPSIIVPFFGDQAFWGERVARLGVGPRPIPRRRLTADRLAQAIQQAVSDQGLRQGASDLGARIRAEDGIAKAVAAINAIKPG